MNEVTLGLAGMALAAIGFLVAVATGVLQLTRRRSKR